MLKAPGQLVRMLVQQTRVRAGQSVFRQNGDDVEQRTADLIVKVFREQLFLPGLREAAPHVFGKVGQADWISDRLKCMPTSPQLSFGQNGRSHRCWDTSVETSF